jgi:hypothetical protein
MRASTRSAPCAGSNSNGYGRRINKERAMRRLKLKWLWARLKEIAAMDLDREELLMKLGAARARAWAAWRLVNVEVAPEGAAFSFTLDRAKLRQVRRREGRYLLRTNLTGKDPLWLIVRISAILCAPSDPALSPADDRMRAARAASMRRILRLNRVDFQIVRQHIWTV